MYTPENSLHPAQKLAASASASIWDVLRAAWAAGHVLPTDSNERKRFPIQTGCVEYAPAALVAMAAVSKVGNDKHNPGQELHHSRSKSADHSDCIMRHDIDAGDPTTDKLEEMACKVWRTLVEFQVYAESLGAPKAPRAR
jgi:hypothetical protein